MGYDKFKELVHDFVDTYAYEYMREVTVEFEPPNDNEEPPHADIKCVDHRCIEWIVPITIDGDEIVIDIGDAGFLNANDGGFYAYLWNEAAHRVYAA